MNLLSKYTLAVRVIQYMEREISWVKARSLADDLGKPLLNAGCGGELWHFAADAISRRSDTNLDIVPRNVPNFVLGDVQDLSMFGDKKFGVAFCSHTLEHVEDPERAIQELHRVADHVVIITPSWWDIATYFNPDHQWLLSKDGNWVRLRQPQAVPAVFYE